MKKKLVLAMISGCGLAAVAACSLPGLAPFYAWDVQVVADQPFPDAGVCVAPGGQKFPQSKRTEMNIDVAAQTPVDACGWASAHARINLGMLHPQCDPKEAIKHNNDDDTVHPICNRGDSNYAIKDTLWFKQILGKSYRGVVNHPLCAGFQPGVVDPFAYGKTHFQDFMPDASAFPEAGAEDDAGAFIDTEDPPSCNPQDLPDASGATCTLGPGNTGTTCAACIASIPQCCNLYDQAGGAGSNADTIVQCFQTGAGIMGCPLQPPYQGVLASFVVCVDQTCLAACNSPPLITLPNPDAGL